MDEVLLVVSLDVSGSMHAAWGLQGGFTKSKFDEFVESMFAYLPPQTSL
jgi:hypothetical protein